MNKLIKHLNKLLLIGTLLTQSALAQDQVVPLNKGDTAPIEGILIPKKIETWIRTEREISLKTLSVTREQLSVYKTLTETQATNIAEQVKLSQALSQEVEARKKATMYWGIGGVVAGILLTTLVISQVK